MPRRTLNKLCPHCHTMVTIHYEKKELILGWGSEWVWPDHKQFACTVCGNGLYSEPTASKSLGSDPQKGMSTCSVCASPTEVVEKIEGGGDTIQRRICTRCGKESYVGMFSFQPRQISVGLRSSRGKYYCETCRFGTDCKECPCCKSKLG